MPLPSEKTAWDFMPEGRSPAQPITQLEHARRGDITAPMQRVAEREPHLSPSQVRGEVAAGRMVIPAHKVHLSHQLAGQRVDHRGAPP